MRARGRSERVTQICPNSPRGETGGRASIVIWMHYMDANWTYGEKAWRQLHKNAASDIEQVLEAAPHKTASVWTPTTHHENYQN